MRRWVVGAVCSVVVGCGGSTPAPREVGTGERPRKNEALVAAVSENPSEPPSDALIWVQLGSPARDLPLVASYGIAPDEVKTVLENPGFFVRAFAGEELMTLIDLGQPVDFLMPRSEERTGRGMTVAFRLRDPKDLDKNAPSRQRIDERRWLFEMPDGALLTERCELWRAPAPVGFRIVCGGETHIVDHAAFLLGPKVSGAAPKSVRIEVSGATYAHFMREEMKASREESDALTFEENTGEELGRRWVEEFMSQSRGFSLEADLGASDVELGVRLAFSRGTISSALEGWFGSGRPTAATPESFFRLPGDSGLAFGSSGVAPGTSGATNALVREFFTALREGFEVSDADWLEIEQATLGILPDDGRFAMAFGRDATRARELLGSVRTAEASGKKPSAKQLAELDAALAGWAVIAVEQKPEKYLDALRRFVKASEIPAPKKKKKKDAPGSGSGSASSAARGSDDDENDPSNEDMKLSPKLPAGFPKKALHIVNEVRPNPKYKPPADGSKPPPIPHDVHVFAVPEGARVWLAFARDERVAARRALAQLTARSNNGIGYKPELDELAEKRAVAVGALSIAGLETEGIDADSEASRLDASDRLARVHALPSRGQSLIPLWIEVGHDAAHAEWQVATRGRLAKRALAELVKWIADEAGVVTEQ